MEWVALFVALAGLLLGIINTTMIRLDRRQDRADVKRDEDSDLRDRDLVIIRKIDGLLAKWKAGGGAGTGAFFQEVRELAVNLAHEDFQQLREMFVHRPGQSPDKTTLIDILDQAWLMVREALGKDPGDSDAQ